MKTKLFTAATLLILSACTAKLYIPVSSDAALLQSLNTGKDLYEKNCGKCHRLHSPSQFDADGWNKKLDIMQPKAKITDEQRNLIFKYLTYHNPKS